MARDQITDLDRTRLGAVIGGDVGGQVEVHVGQEGRARQRNGDCRGSGDLLVEIVDATRQGINATRQAVDTTIDGSISGKASRHFGRDAGTQRGISSRTGGCFSRHGDSTVVGFGVDRVLQRRICSGAGAGFGRDGRRKYGFRTGSAGRFNCHCSIHLTDVGGICERHAVADIGDGKAAGIDGRGGNERTGDRVGRDAVGRDGAVRIQTCRCECWGCIPFA